MICAFPIANPYFTSYRIALQSDKAYLWRCQNKLRISTPNTKDNLNLPLGLKQDDVNTIGPSRKIDVENTLTPWSEAEQMPSEENKTGS